MNTSQPQEKVTLIIIQHEISWEHVELNIYNEMMFGGHHQNPAVYVTITIQLPVFIFQMYSNVSSSFHQVSSWLEWLKHIKAGLWMSSKVLDHWLDLTSKSTINRYAILSLPLMCSPACACSRSHTKNFSAFKQSWIVVVKFTGGTNPKLQTKHWLGDILP